MNIRFVSLIELILSHAPKVFAGVSMAVAMLAGRDRLINRLSFVDSFCELNEE